MLLSLRVSFSICTSYSVRVANRSAFIRACKGSTFFSVTYVSCQLAAKRSRVIAIKECRLVPCRILIVFALSDFNSADVCLRD